MHLLQYFTSPNELVVSPHPRRFGGVTVLPDRVTLSSAASSGSGGISLVGREILLVGVVGTCVSTVGVVISHIVLTRA